MFKIYSAKDKESTKRLKYFKKYDILNSPINTILTEIKNAHRGLQKAYHGRNADGP